MHSTGPHCVLLYRVGLESNVNLLANLQELEDSAQTKIETQNSNTLAFIDGMHNYHSCILTPVDFVLFKVVVLVLHGDVSLFLEEFELFTSRH